MQKNIPVQTMYGEILVTVTDADHTFVSCANYVVRGKSLYFTLHLYKNDMMIMEYQKPLWNTKNHCDFDIRKNGGVFREHATEKQRQAVIEYIIPFMNKWLGNHPELMQQAGREKINGKILELQKRKEELYQQMEETDTEIANLNQRLKDAC